MKSIVYLATSPSGKNYIGITSKSLKRRKIQHFSSANGNSDYKFHRALRKYGKSMKWMILKTINNFEDAKELEKGYIALFNTFKCGYNSTLGGDGQLGRTFSHSEETKLKIKKNNYWTGKKRPHSEETKRKIGNAQRGKSKKPMKAETKLKLSQLRTGKLNGMYGKKPWNYKESV